MISLPLCEATTDTHSRECGWNDDEGNWWEVRVVGGIAHTLVRWYTVGAPLREFPPPEWDDPTLHVEPK